MFICLSNRTNILTDSSLILQITHCLQSIHCQGIVRIFATNLSEYCKHDGWPWRNWKMFSFRKEKKSFRNTRIATFDTMKHFFRQTIWILRVISQTETADTDWFCIFLKRNKRISIEWYSKRVDCELFFPESLSIRFVWPTMNVEYVDCWLPWLFDFRSDHLK